MRIPGPSGINLPSTSPTQIAIRSDVDQGLGNFVQGIGQIAIELQQRRQQAEDAGFLAYIAENSEPTFNQIFEENKNKAIGQENFTQELDIKLGEATEKMIKTGRELGFRPSDEALQRVKLSLANDRGRYLTNAVTYENNQRIELLTSQIGRTVDSMAMTVFNDPRALDQKLLESADLYSQAEGLYSPAEMQDRVEATKNHITLSAIKGLINQDPDGAFAGLKAGDYDDLIDVEEKDALLSSAEAAVEAKALQQSKLAEEAIQAEYMSMATAISDLEVAINSDQGDMVEQTRIVNDLYEKFKGTKLFPLSKRTELLTKIANRSKQSFELGEGLALVAERLNGDDSVIVDRGVIDKVYDKFFASSFPEQGNAHKATFVDRMKYVPKQVKNEVINGLRSGNDQLILEAADMMDRIDHVPGLIEDTFSPHDRAFGTQVKFLLNYLPEEEAIKQARQITDPNDRDRIEARQKIIKDEKWSAEYVDVIEDKFDMKFFGTTVDDLNRDQLTGDYRRLLESYFTAGMDKDQAEQAALRDMRRIWGVSQASGRERVMKYPPELFYGFPEEIATQLKTDVESVWQSEYDDYFLVADDKTARDASVGEPTYRVLIKDKSGLTPLVGFRWKPDVESVRQKQVEENKQTIKNKRLGLEIIKNTEPLPSGPIDQQLEEQEFMRRLGDRQ